MGRGRDRRQKGEESIIIREEGKGKEEEEGEGEDEGKGRMRILVKSYFKGGCGQMTMQLYVDHN